MNLPKTYKDLMRGEHAGWQVETAYYLELDHKLMGQFPALVKETGRVIITLNPELLGQIRLLLSPRRSKISSSNFAVHHQIGYGYPIWDYGEPEKIFTQADFDELIAKDPHPFEWAPGLISNDMSAEEFGRTLAVAAQHEDI